MFKKPNCPVIAIEEHYWDPALAKHYIGPEAGRGNETDERLYDLGALRLRTYAVKNRTAADFPGRNDGGYDPAVVLDLDYWVLMPR